MKTINKRSIFYGWHHKIKHTSVFYALPNKLVDPDRASVDPEINYSEPITFEFCLRSYQPGFGTHNLSTDWDKAAF